MLRAGDGVMGLKRRLQLEVFPAEGRPRVKLSMRSVVVEMTGKNVRIYSLSD
jgi:hypothetical protein